MSERDLPAWEDIRALGRNLVAVMDDLCEKPEFAAKDQSRLARTIAFVRDQKQFAENERSLGRIVFRQV
ncbi:MAG: hypothetical protein Kow0069_07340 [Promethearchaeota archaeon]